MLGLIKKDLFMIKGNLKTIVIIFLVFSLMAIDGNNNFAFIPAFISVMVMMTTFSYDEYNKSDAYISTFPDGRKNAVKSKYVTTILIIFLSVLLTFIISFIVGYFKESMNMKEILESILGCSLAIVIVQSILYPLIYKFGVEKSRIGMFVGVFSITALIAVIMRQGVSIEIPQGIKVFFNNYGMIILMFLTLMILFISYKISKFIYIKKDL